ncbi:unnamed protein product [Paramecium primaurelia]|uniref:P-type ATPase C-terminal domain-containing protein n=1 Tax=Paramecium primaurelia TaxID=5886 RepID=A0A8S1P317_PARPR|nr:unnamed protein product [Paramecium primaurelia]
MQSLDGSSRDIINSIDSANKITAKQFMKQNYTDTEARIKINKLHDQPQEEILNQSQIDLQGKQITIKSTLTINALYEKTKFQIIIESFLYGFANFPLLYYIILLIASINYEVIGFYNQLYMGLQIVFCFLISFYDTFMNKINLYRSIEQADQQQIFVYIEDEFRECSLGQLQPGHLIKLLPKQKCPADGIIVGTSGVSENIPILEIGGQTITRKAGVANFSVGRQLEGKLEFDSEDKKVRVTLKMETAQFSHDFQQQNKIRILQANNSFDEIYILVTGQTLQEQKEIQSSAYEKTKINPKLGFSLHIQNIIIIIFTLLLSVTLLAAHFIQTKYMYLDDKVNEGQMKTFLQFLCTFSWGIPIMQIPLILIINRISKFQAEHDRLIDVDISGKKVEIINSNALANMARAKYILTDLNLLTRQSLVVNNILLNKQSDEINLNDLVTVTPIEDIDDLIFCQQEIKFALLAFQTSQKSEEDIATQKRILEYGLSLGINGNLRIIQDQEQNQQYFQKKFEVVTSKYLLVGYEQILKEDNKQYLIVFRQKFIDCKELLTSEIQLQITSLLDAKDNLNQMNIVFRKIVSMQYIDKITNMVNQQKKIDDETLKQIKSDVEPVLFIEIIEDFYDCSQEIMDIRQCEYKIWINSHIKDPQILENDPTMAGLFEQTAPQIMICQNGDELQVALDQIEKNSQIKNVGKELNLYINDRPILLIIDDATLQTGLKNQLLNEKFKSFFLKIPLVIILNSKPHLNYLLQSIIKSHELICITNYITSTPSMQIYLENQTETAFDIKMPTFSFLPKILIVHGRLNNIRQGSAISLINYLSFILFFIQFVYSCYNRFSQNYLLNEFILFIMMFFTICYIFIFFSMAQDFPFEILRNQPVYHLMVRTPKNPYKLLITQFIQGGFHGTFIVISIIYTFYGSNDQNGYVHGYQLQQFMTFTISLLVIAFKPIVDQYKIVKSQIYLAMAYIFVTVMIIYKNNEQMADLFETGVKTKDLCALVFYPICALSPNLIGQFILRLLQTNDLNLSLYKMEQKHEEESENQKLRDAKNYIRLYQKEELEQQEDIVNSKKVL